MYVISQENFALISAAKSISLAHMYEVIYNILQNPDEGGEAAAGNLKAWFGAASQANSGVGGASDFIRAYTQSQLEIREGEEISGVEQIIQEASDEIAESVFTDILRSKFSENGKLYYIIPDVEQIGEKDAQATLSGLGSFGSSNAIWSGNPLFIGLGIGRFWNETILETAGDTYDLAVAIRSLVAGGVGSFSFSGLSDLVSLFWEQGDPGRSDALAQVSASIEQTTDFFLDAYGEFGPYLLQSAIGMFAGSRQGDVFSTSDFAQDNGWVHVGDGADIIYATSDSASQLDRGGVFDGGEGNDLVSFYYATVYEDGGVTARIIDWESDAAFSAAVDMPFGGSAFLFNIERLHLSEADDRLVIDSTGTSLQEVDAGESLGQGDTFDGSALGSGINFDMQSGAFSPGGTATMQLNLLNFENAIGGAGTDTITGSDQANFLAGGSGADQLFGGGGDDFIFFDAEDILVNGGAGRDVAVAVGQAGVTVDMLAQGLEVVVGSDSADTIIMGGSPDILFAAGGGGADAFVINYDETESPRVIWGGEGADICDFTDGVGGGIAVVRIEDLTRELFANMSIADLNLGDLNLSSFRAIIINPDESDRFRVGGEVFSSDEMPTDVEWKSFSFAGHEHLDSLESAIGRPLVVQGGYERDHQFEATLEVERDAFENVLSIKDYTGRWLADGTDEFDFYEYDPNDQADQDAAADFINTRDDEPVFRMTQLETNPQYGPWYGTFFVVGGEFDGSSLSGNGALIAPTPAGPVETPFDWLLAA